MQSYTEDNKEKVKNILAKAVTDIKSAEALAVQVLKGAQEGLELGSPFGDWLKRFKYQLVWLDRDDYTRALVRALWLAPRFAGTDFGSSRQRDMGQVWTDTARGFLGEIALSKFLHDKFAIETETDTRRGELTEFLPTDITKIKKSGRNWRAPNLKMSIKTTKFNGRWLDVPGAQIEHSDVFILVKIGILRQHFLAFLKAISFLKDKLFPSAVDLGELDDSTAQQLWDEIPAFDPVPAYIAGFINKRELIFPIHSLVFKVKGRAKKRIVITQGIGLFSEETVRNYPKVQEADPTGSLPIEVEPIIDSLTTPHFLAHSGGLEYGEASWGKLSSEL